MSPRPPYQPWQYGQQGWRSGPQGPELRIGDAEREGAASQLAEHYAVGRITQDEHAERLDRIWAARTQSELAPVFEDLPGHAPTAPPRPAGAPRAPRRTPGWTGRPPLPLLVLLVVLGSIAVVAHLPLILVGLGVWFFFFRGGRCGSGPRGHARHW